MSNASTEPAPAGPVTPPYRLAPEAHSPALLAAASPTASASTELSKEYWFRVIFIFLYGLIFLLGLSGNILVVHIVVHNKQMKTITNIFITNLAFSDILMCLVAVPFTPLSAFMSSWVFGDVLCHIVPMILAVSVYVSTLTSTAIAIDRYFVIVHPFKPRMKTTVCLLIIVCIWLISVSIPLPIGIYHQLVPKGDIITCREVWPADSSRQFFTLTSLILQYLVPCVVITYCYTRVSIALRRRSKHKIGTRSSNKEKEEIELKRKRRTNRMLIAMVSIFVCCWLPLNIVLLVTDAQDSFMSWKYFRLIFFISHVIAMSSTCYNPILYAWMNENFRKQFQLVLPFLSSSAQKPQHANGEKQSRAPPQRLQLAQGNDISGSADCVLLAAGDPRPGSDYQLVRSRYVPHSTPSLTRMW